VIRSWQPRGKRLGLLNVSQKSQKSSLVIRYGKVSSELIFGNY